MTDLSAKLTPLGVMVLALLREGDMHPYEMMRLMRFRRDDRLVPIQNGTFYHTVGRLERAGLLAEIGVDRDGNRPERTTYTLTDAGRDVVGEWVRRELPRIDRTTEFRVALAERGIDATVTAADEVTSAGTTPETVGRVIGAIGLVIYEMRLDQPNLEDVFIALTNEGAMT